MYNENLAIPPGILDEIAHAFRLACEEWASALDVLADLFPIGRLACNHVHLGSLVDLQQRLAGCLLASNSMTYVACLGEQRRKPWALVLHLHGTQMGHMRALVAHTASQQMERT